MISRILCRLGWHTWKLVLRVPAGYVRLHGLYDGETLEEHMPLATWAIPIGHQCRHCGKRVRL